MWPPVSKTFTSYNAAYEYFLKVSPALEDPDNKAERFEYQQEIDKEFVLIESRVQTPGYLEGDGTCSKRPQGALFAATRLVKIA
jgi:hypothetical protein